MDYYEWEPGNGTRYHIEVWQVTPKDVSPGPLLCWMLRGGSGGTCMRLGTGFLNWSYMSEKMGIKSRADIAGLLAFVHSYGLADVGMPPGYGLDGLRDGSE